MKINQTQADAKAQKPKEPSESEICLPNLKNVSLVHFCHCPLTLMCFPLCLHSALASILRAWLDQCPEDFQEPPDYPCLHRMIDYLRRALPGSEPLRRAEGLLEQLQSQACVDDTDGNASIIHPSVHHLFLIHSVQFFIF